MGPIVSPWTALPVSRRWLVLFVIPAGTALGLALECPRDAPAVAVTVTYGSPQQQVADEYRRLDQIAASHRLWVKDHGAGCAREIDRLLPYTGQPLADPWGTALALHCYRGEFDGADEIEVLVRSAGPDRIRDTTDDIVGRDIQRLTLATWH